MGFEQDYREGMRDRCWGKSIRAFATGRPDAEVSQLIHQALCKHVRNRQKLGGHAALLEVAGRYEESLGRAQSLAHESLFPTSENKGRVIQEFVDDCARAACGDAAAHDVGRLTGLGVDALRDTFDGLRPDNALESSNTLIVDLLHECIEGRMQAALVIAGQKCSEAPDAVLARFERVVAKVPLSSISAKIREGNAGKVVARMPRAKVKHLAEQSLMRKH